MAETTLAAERATLEISRDRWNAFLADFTRINRGAHATLEVLGGDPARVVEAEDRPFDGISADVKDGEDTVWILFGSTPDDHLTHGIPRATALFVRERSDTYGATVEVVA